MVSRRQHAWLIIVAFLCITELRITDAQSDFAFTSQKWVHLRNPRPRKYLSVDDSLIFLCQTNDKDASVTLLYTDRPKGVYEDTSSKFSERSFQQGQTFVVNQIKLTDIGYYKCKAVNKQNEEIFLTLGQLFVNRDVKVYTPDLYPDRSTFKIETNGRENITCKAHGKIGVDLSYLTWYKEENGKRIPVDRSTSTSTSIFRTEEIYGGNYIDVEILAFSKFSTKDIGAYICMRRVGSNTATEKRIDIELEPNVSPKLSFQDEVQDKVSYKSNTNIVVTCIVEGSPTPKKYWQKDGVVVFDCPDPSDPKCSLVLRKVQHPKDSGEYLCVGENLVKKVTKSLFVEVQVPPELKKLSTRAVANPSQDQELLCELKSGNPLVTFVWEEQPDTCEDSNAEECQPLEKDWKAVKKQYPSSTTATNSSYIIAAKTNVTYFYRCSVASIAGKDFHTIHLLRREQVPPQFHFTSNATEPNEEDNLHFKCVADIHVFQSLNFMKNDQILAASSLSKTNSTLVLTYSIPSINIADSANYSCKANLRRGGVKSHSLFIKVKELTTPVIKNFNDVIISQRDVTHFNIFCEASGNPSPSISWKHNNKTLEYFHIESIERCDVMNRGFYHLKGNNSVLMFCDVNYEMHAGSYECTATNKVGEVSRSMQLIVNAKPEIIEWKNTTLIDLGESKEIVCSTSASPPANVTWFRMTNASTAIASSVGSSVLRINDFNVKDFGKYQCIAINKFGRSSQITNVKPFSIVIAAATAENKKTTIYTVIVIFAVILGIILVLVLMYRRHLKNKYALYLEPNDNFVLDHNRSLFEQSSELPYHPSWEFPRERVNLVKTLGAGAFGQVWLAEADGIRGFKPRDQSNDAKKRRKAIQKSKRYHALKNKQIENVNPGKNMVAVKTLKDDAAEEEYKDLASELKILIHLGEHKNIVNLLGACTTGGGKLFVILECCSHGNLLNFLREKREVFRPYWLKIDHDINNEFTYVDLMSIACQVSDGMDFLQSKKCIHRDLAARNVLVGDDYVIKIADFGLARDIYKDEFYLKQTTSLLPVKWMSPEALFDKVFTSSSDVWSFGILLWELFTLGGSPYPGLPTEDLFSYLQDGRRMERPDLCPKDMYEVMLNCWEKSPYKRPLFAKINETFTNIIRNNVPEGSQFFHMGTKANGNYENVDRKESADSAGYIEDVSDKKVFSSPKGETYVPPPDLTLPSDEQAVRRPLISDGDEYIPMTPAAHYQSPPPYAFTYGDEAMV